MNFEILVNKENILSEDYIPNDLINTYSITTKIGKHLDPNYQVYLNKTAFEHFNELAKNAPFTVIIDSGYRTYQYQKELAAYLFKTKGEESEKLVAPPGASEHQTGLAIDVAFIINGEYHDDIENYPKEIKWIQDNCHDYGFILRYPEDKIHITKYNFEPWHIRFVGIELAKEMKKNNLTLEEYHRNK